MRSEWNLGSWEHCLCRTWAGWRHPRFPTTRMEQAILDLQSSSDPSPPGSCTVACVKWTGGHSPGPIRQMSTSQREHHTQQPAWPRGDRTGCGKGTALCPSSVPAQWSCSQPEGGGHTVWQQLSEENSVFIEPSNPWQNASKHLSEVVSFILTRSHVFPH